MPSITVEQTREETDLDAIRKGMRRYTEQHVPWETYEELTIALRDHEGKFLGGALGEAGRGWLKVSVLWVHENVRGQGYGRQLMRALESEAVKRGCREAYLDTFSYQAKPFYERLGYTVFGTLEDYPLGHCRYYMRKRLDGADRLG